MLELSNYIRNIAVFLIFASFVTIISPGEKYERYINLVLGIILIFVVASPLMGVIGALSGSSGGIFADISLQYDRAAMAGQIENADEAGREMIISGYREALTEQMERIVRNHGEFVLHRVDFEIDTRSRENFGKILGIYIVVGKASVAGRTPFITIDPVRIAVGVNTRGELGQNENAETHLAQIMSLKNVISDFYNLDMENIILETRDQ